MPLRRCSGLALGPLDNVSNDGHTSKTTYITAENCFKNENMKTIMLSVSTNIAKVDTYISFEYAAPERLSDDVEIKYFSRGHAPETTVKRE